MSKVCGKCKKDLPDSAFGNRGSRLQSYCKECSKNYHSVWTKTAEGKASQKRRDEKWNEKNPEYRSDWYQANLDRERAKRRDWFVRHPGYDRERYLANRESMLAKMKEWRKANPEKVRDLGRQAATKRRALLADVPSEPYTVNEIVGRDGEDCGLCGQKIDRSIRWPDPMSLSVDHIVPLSRGGSDLFDNVQVAHLFCNLSKSNNYPLEGRNIDAD